MTLNDHWPVAPEPEPEPEPKRKRKRKPRPPSPASVTPSPSSITTKASWPSLLRLASLLSLLFITLLGLKGCATAPITRPSADQVSGRLAVRVAAHHDRPMRSVSALFDLQSQGDSGELDLSTPLGTLIGKVQWGPQQVSLLTQQGLRQYPSLGALSEDLWGENIPLQAMFDWLNGRPWSGTPATPLPGPPGTGFTQLGWRIQLDQWPQGIIQAQREAEPQVFFHARLLR